MADLRMHSCSGWSKRLAIGLFVGWLAAGLADAEVPTGEDDGPRLDEIPGPEAATRDLPVPTAWPVLRYERPLHLLAVLDKQYERGAAYQRIARRMRSTVEFRYFSSPGEDQPIYHVNDKWIEPDKNPTIAELSKHSLEVVADTLRVKDGRPPADVIFCGMLDDPNRPSEGDFALNLLDCVKAGATLVTCGNVYPGSNSVFFAEWPARPTRQNSWMTQGSQRADGPALAGLPLPRLAAHTWIPIAEATDGSSALSTGEAGAVFVRKVGAGAIVFAPTGLISRKWDAILAFGRQYDHDDIWLRLWDQLLYETARGPEAMPAYGDLRPGAKEAAPGQEYVLPGRIVNPERFRGPLAVSVHVTTPRGAVVYAKTETLQVPAGSEQPYEVRVPVGPDWGAGLYPVYLTVGDPSAKKQFHQSLEFIPVTGSLALALKSEKRGYRLGEEARFTLTAASAAPWSGTLDFGVYDFRGRLLAAASQPAALVSTNAQPFAFTFRMADHGVRADTFWAQVAARKDGREWGRAETKFYKHEPWSMRNECQSSTWAANVVGPPSLAPRAMRLMAHAGLNALGYAGGNELHYSAERWGWRYYNEGIGMNTWNPNIEWASDAELETALRKEAEGKSNAPDLASAAFVLASVGEEAGFGPGGWGCTYYWNTPVAPENAGRAFQWYLKSRYTDLARLNATWRTNYQSWDEVKLTKEFSGAVPKLEADGWAHPKESSRQGGISLAPYSDTGNFYAWYYDRVVAAAKRIFREKINPVPVTMASAPASGIFDSRECDVRLAGPGGWNESQWHSTMDGPEPGFSLVWGHFDWSVKTDNLFWGFLLTRSGHNDYWVDVPLMFNNDLTHTRASFEIRKWTHRFASRERILLDSRPAPSDVGLLGANGVGMDLTRSNMAVSLQVALNQGGFGLPVTDAKKLGACKILFAIGRQAVSREEAERLEKFVADGGWLVFTPRFANQDEFGAPQPISPGQGLAEKWGFQITERTEAIPQDYSATQQTFSLDGVGDSLKGFRAATHAIFREKVKPEGWTPLAEYDDHTPALLSRARGKGRLVYVNAIDQSHWYIQFVTPTGPDRQGFYKLVEWLCEQAGARRALRLDGDLAQALHLAVKQFTDPTGQIRYVVVRTAGEAPWIAAKLTWLGPQTAGYDVLGNRPGQPAPLVGREFPLVFKPGEGQLLAFIARPVKRLRLEAAPGAIRAGEPIRLTVSILDADGQAVPGNFPFDLRGRSERAPIDGLQRSFSAQNGEGIVLHTALNDPPGKWILDLTDEITGASASASVRVRPPSPGRCGEAGASTTADHAPGFVPWGWPSELEEPAALSEAQFLAQLGALARLYQQDHSADGWMTKQRLGYYFDFFPNTRHAFLRPLNDVDWPQYVEAIRRALRAGETFILTGEDVNLDPGSGLATYPHHDGQPLTALTGALRDAKWSLATSDGDTVQARMGTGRFILCRESIDAAGRDRPAAGNPFNPDDSASLARWQQRWREELREQESAPAVPISTPNAESLRRWWVGAQALTTRPRTVTWFDGNQRELKISLDPARPLGEVFTLGVPPTGEVKGVSLATEFGEAGEAQFDVGCDGAPDADWSGAVARAARLARWRDGSGWRIVPVRVTATSKAEVKLKNVRITVQ